MYGSDGVGVSCSRFGELVDWLGFGLVGVFVGGLIDWLGSGWLD